MAEELRLKSLKPRTWELEEDEHPATMDSLAWAEKQLDHKMVIPHIDPVPPQPGSEAYEKIFDYEDDDEVSSTLKSAHQAEMIYNLHNTYRGYGYNNTNTANGTNSYDYGWWNKPAGLNGEVEHQQYKNQIPSWGGNSTHNAYDKKYGDPEPEKQFNGYGYGSPYSRDNANKDWYNHLVKDTGNFGDGMHSSQVGIMDPHHGHFSDSRFANMTKEAIEEVGKSILARQQRERMTPEDIAAAKAVKEVLGIYDGSQPKKDGEQSSEEGKPSGDPAPATPAPAAPAAPAPAADQPPPELDPNAAPSATLSQAKPE